MRLNSQRNSQRNDFEDFTRFLGLNGQRNSSQKIQNVQGSVENSSQTRYQSGAKCDLNEQGVTGAKSLAMVYAPMQAYRNIFDPEIALINGTIFQELHKPFLRASCRGTNDNGEGCF